MYSNALRARPLQVGAMTAFDYIVLTILTASVVISVLRGLVREILSLAAWVAAFLVASHFAADIAALLPAGMGSDTLRIIAGFAILLVGTLLAGALVNLAIGQIIKALGLQLVDRGLGGLFGLARGVLIVLVLVILAGLTNLPSQPFWRDALLAPLCESAVRTAKPLLPDSWAQHVHY
jgi:membrane protein required for colicin V production